jgi:predicted SnoaL-like aldol condensation-catalyzing enzyme
LTLFSNSSTFVQKNNNALMKDQGQWENRALEILDKASKKNPKLTANDREDLANYFNTMKASQPRRRGAMIAC